MDTKFKYDIYISSSPERVWNALIDPEMTEKYWQHENKSDWKIGSGWEHRRTGETHGLDLVGEVIEFSPPRRLVLSWAFPQDKADRKKHSRVTIEIVPVKGVVLLSVAHEGLEPGSEMLQGISEGWPIVLSGLKSLLETGKPLPKLWEEEEERISIAS